MKFSVLGSGMVGQTIAAKLAELKHEVQLGTRSPEKLHEWAAAHPGLSVGSLSASAAFGEVVFNAMRGAGSLESLQAAGAANLNGKILIDISNPLDFAGGMPPSLFVSNTDSLGEQIQRAFPEVKVVKTLNTLSAPLMVNPRMLADGDHTLFVSGNDAEAKAQVTQLLTDLFGWRDIMDVGDITTARGTEALLALWTRLFIKRGDPNFQFKVVR